MRYIMLVPIMLLVASCADDDVIIKKESTPFDFIKVNAIFDLPGKINNTRLENIQQIQVIAHYEFSDDSRLDYYYYQGGSENDVVVTANGSETILRLSGTLQRYGNRVNPVHPDPELWKSTTVDYDLVFTLDSAGVINFNGGSVVSDRFTRSYGEVLDGRANAIKEQNDVEWLFNNELVHNFVNYEIKVNDVYGTDFKN